MGVLEPIHMDVTDYADTWIEIKHLCKSLESMGFQNICRRARMKKGKLALPFRLRPIWSLGFSIQKPGAAPKFRKQKFSLAEE
jgi:hypothetical protein